MHKLFDLRVAILLLCGINLNFEPAYQECLSVSQMTDKLALESALVANEVIGVYDFLTEGDTCLECFFTQLATEVLEACAQRFMKSSSSW